MSDNRELAVSMPLDDWWLIICALSEAGDAYREHRDALRSIHAIAENRAFNHNLTLWPSSVARACVTEQAEAPEDDDEG